MRAKVCRPLEFAADRSTLYASVLRILTHMPKRFLLEMF
jgi:hypothetical protein